MRHEKQVGKQRQRRGFRVRNRLKRDATRPRLSVFRSHQNIYAQIIDDARRPDPGWPPARRTSNCATEFRYGGNKTAAAAVGKAIAQRAAGRRHQGSRVRPPRVQVSRPRGRLGRRRPRSRIGVLIGR